jgi:hypothetical protein
MTPRGLQQIAPISSPFSGAHIHGMPLAKARVEDGGWRAVRAGTAENWISAVVVREGGEHGGVP